MKTVRLPRIDDKGNTPKGALGSLRKILEVEVLRLRAAVIRQELT